MKKQSIKVIVVLLCLMVAVYVVFPRPPCSIQDLEKRAVWLSYQDLSKLSYKSINTFKEDFIDILQTVQKYQTNTLIIQVRPFADALYSSTLYPTSTVVTQQQLSFDPLEEMIELSHEQGIEVEAWINPYRICFNKETYEQFMRSSKSSWLNNEELTIHYGNYQYIFNPASSIVRDYIVDGIAEIVKNYDVDGIHFDDYFYVQGTHQNTTEQSRKDNVNLMIQAVYKTIKDMNEDVSFGISPQGNYDNCINEGADIDTWLQEEGYIDYLMPQVYWSNQYGQDGHTTMFTNRIQQFANIKHSHVTLYVGLALYQAGEQLDYDQGWSTQYDNISQQVQILYDYGYQGYSLFHYENLLSNAGQKEMDELLRVHP